MGQFTYTQYVLRFRKVRNKKRSFPGQTVSVHRCVIKNDRPIIMIGALDEKEEKRKKNEIRKKIVKHDSTLDSTYMSNRKPMEAFVSAPNINYPCYPVNSRSKSLPLKLQPYRGGGLNVDGLIPWLYSSVRGARDVFGPNTFLLQ